MRVISDSDSTPAGLADCAVAVGNFDGVHLGHRHLLKTICARARKLGGPSVVYTFDPHPLKVLNPSACPPTLTDFAQKAMLIEELGVDYLVRARFDHEYAARPPQWFAEEVLGNDLQAAEVWVGPDFAFGRNRTGNVETLRRAGERLGYCVSSLEPFLVDGERVSSTRVRRAVTDRDFLLAARLLGRPFALHGPVVHGEARGDKLGFPTANLLPREECVPPAGVYAARARIEGGGPWRDAAVNIGANPTFGARVTTIEAHLLHFTGDLYGKAIELVFVAPVRGEIAFASVAGLVEQIGRDVSRVEAILKDSSF